MGKRLSGLLRHAEYADRKSPHRARHPVAVEVEGPPVRRPDILRGVHRHAVDDGVEVLALEVIVADRPREIGKMLRRVAPQTAAATSVAPALKLGRRSRASPGPVRRPRRRPRDRRRKARTWPCAAVSAKCASRNRRNCAPRARSARSRKDAPGGDGSIGSSSRRGTSALPIHRRARSRPCRDGRARSTDPWSRDRGPVGARARWMAAISAPSRASRILETSGALSATSATGAPAELGQSGAQRPAARRAPRASSRRRRAV